MSSKIPEEFKNDTHNLKSAQKRYPEITSYPRGSYNHNSGATKCEVVALCKNIQNVTFCFNL